MSSSSLIRMLALAALWGGAFLLMRIAAPVLGAPVTAFARVMLGAAGLFAWVLVRRVPLAFRGRFGATLALGAINSGLPFLLYALAARALPAGYSAILNATTPLMGVVIGAAWFAERITGPKLAGIGVGLLGVVVLSGAGPVPLNAATLWGMAACLGATLCYAVAGHLTTRWIGQRGGLDSRLVALGSQWGAVLVLAPVAAWQWAQQAAVPAVTPRVAVAVLLLGLLCTSLAYVLYFRLIADVGAAKALLVTFLIPLFGVLWGWGVLGEPVTLAHGLGGGLIAVALWLVLRVPNPE